MSLGVGAQVVGQVRKGLGLLILTVVLLHPPHAWVGDCGMSSMEEKGSEAELPSQLFSPVALWKLAWGFSGDREGQAAMHLIFEKGWLLGYWQESFWEDSSTIYYLVLE